MLEGVPPDPLLDVADELYALPLGEFTRARDLRAKELKGQDRALADRVKALRKPSLAAWVLNLLVRRDPEQVAQVLAVGEALREAQATLDGEQLRALTRQRRQVTGALASTARARAREEGQRVTEAVAEQLESSLTAALLDEGAAAALRSGLLVAALRATGVEAADVSAAVALPEALGQLASPQAARAGTEGSGGSEQSGGSPRPELRVVPDPDAALKRRRAATEALASAQAQLAVVQQEERETGETVAELEARSLQLVAEAEELRRRLAELDSAAEEVDQELEEAEDEAGEARASVEEAEAEVARAQAALDALGTPGTPRGHR